MDSADAEAQVISRSERALSRYARESKRRLPSKVSQRLKTGNQKEE